MWQFSTVKGPPLQRCQRWPTSTSGEHGPRPRPFQKQRGPKASATSTFTLASLLFLKAMLHRSMSSIVNGNKESLVNDIHSAITASAALRR
jgi:hypothetical protein